MSKALTTQNLLKKKYNTFPFTDSWQTVFGRPSTTGFWIIYGKEKNGKTWGTLLLSDYLSSFKKVLYVSAEEGTDIEFQQAVKRAKISHKNKNLNFIEYEPIDQLMIRLKKQRAADIIVIDNTTVYNSEIKSKDVLMLKNKFPHKLFIFIAHEERGKPYTALAERIKKYAKVIIRVAGLKLFISGRCPGGCLYVDEKQAALYHGQD